MILKEEPIFCVKYGIKGNCQYNLVLIINTITFSVCVVSVKHNGIEGILVSHWDFVIHSVLEVHNNWYVSYTLDNTK